MNGILTKGMHDNVKNKYSEWLDFMIEASARINHVVDFAEHIHRDQKYGDKPYSYHLRGVALNVLHLCSVLLPESKGEDYDPLIEDAVIVAYLHDSIEDGKTTMEYLSRQFVVDSGLPPEYMLSENVLGAVENLTRRDNEMYLKYVIRVCNEGTSMSKMVKLADLRFNMTENLREIESGKKNFKQMYDKYSLAQHIVMQSIH